MSFDRILNPDHCDFCVPSSPLSCFSPDLSRSSMFTPAPCFDDTPKFQFQCRKSESDPEHFCTSVLFGSEENLLLDVYACWNDQQVQCTTVEAVFIPDAEHLVLVSRFRRQPVYQTNRVVFTSQPTPSLGKIRVTLEIVGSLERFVAEIPALKAKRPSEEDKAQFCILSPYRDVHAFRAPSAAKGIKKRAASPELDSPAKKMKPRSKSTRAQRVGRTATVHAS